MIWLIPLQVFLRRTVIFYIMLDDSEKFVQTSYTGNDQVLLWDKGSLTLSTVNTTNYAIEDLKDFWINSLKKRKLTPMLAVATNNGQKVMGFGHDEQEIEGAGYIIFYSGGKRTQNQGSMYHANISSFATMEPSLDGSIVFVGGDNHEKPVIGALNFDEKMAVINFVEVEVGNSNCKQVSQLRRFLGRDIIMAACSNFLVCYSYDNKNFTKMKTLEVNGCSEIIEIRIKYNKLIVLDDKGNVFTRRAACAIDYAESYKNGIDLFNVRV